MSLTGERQKPVGARGAEFSDCRTWRYALWRHWDFQGYGNCMAVIGLNPSTADEFYDDPTIRRCINFAKSWGYSGLYMLNLYAFRATDPADMIAAEDPIGPGNDEALGYYQSRVGLILAAWGTLKKPARPRVNWDERINHVFGLLRSPEVKCLGRTADGSPRHPLYVRADQKPVSFSPDWQR